MIKYKASLRTTGKTFGNTGNYLNYGDDRVNDADKMLVRRNRKHSQNRALRSEGTN